MAKRKILLVDDEVDFLDLMKTRLEANGYEVIAANNGKEALDRFKDDKPAAVLLDIMMPDKDGRDVLKELKADPVTKDIPVIMLTAKAEQFDRDSALAMGAYEYMVKPYDGYALLRQINNVLEKFGKPT